MFENWQKPVSTEKIFILFLRISILHDKECRYLRNLDDEDDDQIKQNIKDLFFYCSKLRPFMTLYKTQILAHNLTAHKF